MTIDLVHLQTYKGLIAIPAFNVLQTDLQAVQMYRGQHRDRLVIQVYRNHPVVHPEAQVYKDQILVVLPGVQVFRDLQEVQEADLLEIHRIVPVQGARQVQKVMVEEDIDLPLTYNQYIFLLIRKGTLKFPYFYVSEPHSVSMILKSYIAFFCYAISKSRKAFELAVLY